MSDLWDYESRWETTTRADTGSYDQVIALSQGIINENFEKLYELYPELHKLYFMDAAIGTLEGDVQAPRVLIPGADEPSANLNQVIFQVRFDAGKLEEADGRAAIPDLTGWTFSIWAPVVPEKLSDPSTIKDPVARKKLEEKIKRIKERFDWPGDYSVERLYMKLSAANWNNPDWERSIAGHDASGNEIPYLTWSLQDENQSTALRLQLWLSIWAGKLENDSMNSLGLTFTSPTTQKIAPTYAPLEVLHQVHQYKSKKNGSENGQTGFGGAGDCNCLMYLEMVQGGGTRPADPRLIWSGNFATQDGGPGHPPVRATYLLNREIFFEKFILRELRALNRASDVYYDPLLFVDSGNGHNFIQMYWRIGSDPNHNTDSDGTYDFKPVADPQNPRKIVSYRWTKRNQQGQDGPLIQKLPVGNGWGKASTDVVMQSDVTWTTGGSEIRLVGTSNVYEHCIWATKADDWSNATSYFHDTYLVSWSLNIRIVPKLEKPPGLDVEVSYLDIDVDSKVATSVVPNQNQHNVRMNGHDDRLLSELNERMADQFDRIIGNIRQSLQTSGRFTYPGNGKLIFEKPGIGRYGDLNAQVRYAPLGREDWIVIPSREPTKPETVVIVKPNPTTGGPIIDDHQLSWTLNTLRALQPNQTLKVRGVNQTSNPLRYAAIIFAFTAGKRQGALFTNDDYVFKPDAPKTTDPPKEDEPSKEDVPPKEDEPSKEEVPPKEEETPQPGKGIVQLLKGDGQPFYKVKVTKLATSRGITNWEVQVSTTAGNTMTLAPGAWIELNITADAGYAALQEFRVDESIRDDQGVDIGHFDKAYEVRVS